MIDPIRGYWDRHARVPLIEALHGENQPDWIKPLIGYTKGKNSRESLGQCQAKLEPLVGGDPTTSAEFVLDMNDTLYTNPFSYKGRYIEQAPMLHIAIWLEASDPKFDGVVQTLISARADMESEKAKASYKSGLYTVELHAITVASGMGSVPVLDALTTNLSPEEIERMLARTDLATSAGAYYYSPLHDACFLGRTAATLWLLEHGAPANKTEMMGMTPIHVFAVSGRFDETGRVEQTVKELVRCRAPLGMKVKLKGPFQARWGDQALTPLEIATQHDTNFPKDCMRFLAPSLHLLLSDSIDADSSNADPTRHASGREALHINTNHAGHDSGRVSFFSDLIMLCKKSPKAAEELADEILNISEEGEQAPLVRQKLIEDAQQPDAVDKLVRLMTAAPNAASSILKALTQEPQIQVPTHYPVRMRTSLWGPLVNSPMRCTYMPDASKARNGVLVPEWFYNAVCQWRPSWHDTFAPKVDDVRDAKSAYDVTVSVLPVPDILGLDFMQALASIDCVTYYKVFACKPVQGIITCMWQTLVQKIYEAEIFLALLDVGFLLSWGLTLGNGAPFSRLWNTGQDDVDESPKAAPIHWIWLAGTCVREYITLLCWFFAFIGRWYMTGGATKALEGLAGHLKCPCSKRLPSSETHVGTWRVAWLFQDSHFMVELLLAAVLSNFLLTATRLESNRGTLDINSQAQAVLALNVFLRCVKLVFLLSAIRAFGPRIIAVLRSLISGAMREMLFISTLVFFAFELVFLVLRRENSAGWTGIYLYRGLIFGDGDGLDRFGISDKEKDFTDQGDKDEHHWSTFYGMVATLLFNIAILNLIIAIYSDEYKEQQKRAPMMFVELRSNICAASILKYHTLGWLVPVAVWVRWAILLVMLVASTAWMCAHHHLAEQYLLDRGTHLGIMGACAGIIQITLLTAIAHTVTLPAESPLKDEPKRSGAALRAYLPKLGEHASVPTAGWRCCKRRCRLSVQHAKLINSHCLEVHIAYRHTFVANFRELCSGATLHWRSETKRGTVKPVDVIFPKHKAYSKRDGTSISEATLVFEPVMDIWRPLEICVGGNTVPVRLPHFVWLCCRDDFDQVEGVDDEIDENLQSHAALLRDLKAQVGELTAKLAKAEESSPPLATRAEQKKHVELLQGLQAQIAELSGKVAANQAPMATQAVTLEPEPVDVTVQPSTEAAASAG